MEISKRIIVFFVIILFIAALSAVILGARSFRYIQNENDQPSVETGENNRIGNKSSDQAFGQSGVDGNLIQGERYSFLPPLERARERVTKKPFGVYITPQNSPVQPERFRGYHTGTDFEIFPEELDADVPVAAICEGKIIEKRMASGYGGVLVQKCSFNNQPIAVLYGHLKLSSVSKNADDGLEKGEKIGILGKAGSVETDGERKHLHLAIRKGDKIDIRGYVQNQAELSEWIDLCSFQLVCR